MNLKHSTDYLKVKNLQRNTNEMNNHSYFKQQLAFFPLKIFITFLYFVTWSSQTLFKSQIYTVLCHKNSM